MYNNFVRILFSSCNEQFLQKGRRLVMKNLLSTYTANEGMVNFEETKKLINDVDIVAEKLKNEILNTNTEVTFTGTAYYVSENGDDSNDGLTPKTPWKTLEKVNSFPFAFGDAVFFQRDNLFRGYLSCRGGITYSAYGEGAKPIITTSPENGAGKEKWSLLEGTDNIWVYYKKMSDIGLIVFNDGECHSVKKIPSYINGKFVQRNQPETVFDVRKHMHCDLAHFSETDKELDANGYPSLSYDAKVSLYLRCDKGNPGEIFNSIEFSTRTHGIRGNGCSNITVDNLAILYAGCHGLGTGININHLHVQNCVFGWIGGCVQRYNNNPESERYGWVTVYGNAVEIWGGCDDFVCDHNYIYQVYDAGVTHQFSSTGNDCKQKNIRYTNSLYEFCSYTIEYFLGYPSDKLCLCFMQNVEISGNIMRYSGFGFGEQRPHFDHPAAHIKGWTGLAPLDEGFIIKDNIFDRARNMLIHIGKGPDKWLPTFKNNIYIQYLNHEVSSFGKYHNELVPYDENIREYMNNENIDLEGGVYFAKPDWLYDLPDFLPIIERQ